MSWKGINRETSWSVPQIIGKVIWIKGEAIIFKSSLRVYPIYLYWKNIRGLKKYKIKGIQTKRVRYWAENEPKCTRSDIDNE